MTAGWWPWWPQRPILGGSRGADAVVTGAGSGLGQAFALELARRGGRVLCADVDEVAAERTVARIAAVGPERSAALARRCDVTRLEDVIELAAAADSWFGGPPSLVVNNAGIGAGGTRIGEDTLADWHATHAVNFWGVAYGCHVFLPRLRRAGGGGVLNVASAAAFGAAPRMGAYSTSKAAVVSLSETLAAEVSGTGIRVSVLCPTFVRTGIVSSNGGRIDGGASALATRLMALTGRDPDAVVRTALDAHDAGRLHVAPQIEAHLLWLAKRAFPGPFTHASGLFVRLAEAVATTADTTRGA
ncbi:SDR family NAD(P)-dependent oxidoreductase [Actinomycetospora sp. CA-101289]|uniref:SDR family NAD(P)-dependent oxidoreductase n=1 Tax=Actinomycetospora sp. CA-101289 TaxID=3239893 RepID=UPI003D97E6C1